MTNNQNPKATLSLEMVAHCASLIIPQWNGYPTPTRIQIKSMIDRYCDNPDITNTDKLRIGIRIEQHFGLL